MMPHAISAVVTSPTQGLMPTSASQPDLGAGDAVGLVKDVLRAAEGLETAITIEDDRSVHVKSRGKKQTRKGRLKRGAPPFAVRLKADTPYCSWTVRDRL